MNKVFLLLSIFLIFCLNTMTEQKAVTGQEFVTEGSDSEQNNNYDNSLKGISKATNTSERKAFETFVRFLPVMIVFFPLYSIKDAKIAWAYTTMYAFSAGLITTGHGAFSALLSLYKKKYASSEDEKMRYDAKQAVALKETRYGITNIVLSIVSALGWYWNYCK